MKFEDIKLEYKKEIIKDSGIIKEVVTEINCYIPLPEGTTDCDKYICDGREYYINPVEIFKSEPIARCEQQKFSNKNLKDITDKKILRKFAKSDNFKTLEDCQ